MEFLPDDILIIIFKFFPDITLLKLKRVCKRWFSIIISKYFMPVTNPTLLDICLNERFLYVNEMKYYLLHSEYSMEYIHFCIKMSAENDYNKEHMKHIKENNTKINLPNPTQKFPFMKKMSPVDESFNNSACIFEFCASDNTIQWIKFDDLLINIGSGWDNERHLDKNYSNCIDDEISMALFCENYNFIEWCLIRVTKEALLIHFDLEILKKLKEKYSIKILSCANALKLLQKYGYDIDHEEFKQHIKNQLIISPDEENLFFLLNYNKTEMISDKIFFCKYLSVNHEKITEIINQCVDYIEINYFISVITSKCLTLNNKDTYISSNLIFPLLKELCLTYSDLLYESIQSIIMYIEKHTFGEDISLITTIIDKNIMSANDMILRFIKSSNFIEKKELVKKLLKMYKLTSDQYTNIMLEILS